MGLRQVGSFLSDMLNVHDGEEITITRGAESITIAKAFPSNFRFRVSAPTGESQVVSSDADWIFDADLYVFGGRVSKPRKDDRVSVVRGGVVQKFRVATPTGETPYRFSDTQETRLRIHTMRAD